MSVKPGPQRRLTEAEFFEAALDVVDLEGLAALNTRRLAKALGISPGAPYTYFQSKQDLLDGMLAYALHDLPEPVGEIDDWLVQLEAHVRNIHAAAVRHPAFVELLMRNVNAPAVDPHREHFFVILEKAGFGPAESANIVSMLIAYAVGSVIVDQHRAGPATKQERERRRALDPDMFPRLRAAARLKRPPTLTPFDEGLAALLAHVHARARSSTTASA